MPTMYASIDISIEFLDESKNDVNVVEEGFQRLMPASIIHVGRGNASFRLESDSIISGDVSLKYVRSEESQLVYRLDCCATYKCGIKPDYIDLFLDEKLPGEIGTISLNDPSTGDRIELIPGEPIRGVSVREESGPWGRMGKIITRRNLEFTLTTSKKAPKN